MKEFLTRQNLLLGALFLLILFGIRKGCQKNQNKVRPKLGLVGRFGKPQEGPGRWSQKQLKNTPFMSIIDYQLSTDSKPIPNYYRLETKVEPGKEFIHERLNHLDKISKGASFDSEKGLIVVKGQDLVANVVTHWIIQKYLHGVFTLDEAVGKYGPIAMELQRRGDNSAQFEQLYNELHTNLIE